MELKYIVYITINRCNGKFYIGVHKTNPDVFDGYIGCGIYRQNDANKNYPFHKAVRKYGYSNFIRTTLSIFPNTEKGKRNAYNLEKLIVNEYMIKAKTTYNVAFGGSGGQTLENMKRVYIYHLNGEYIGSFKSASYVADFINPNATTQEKYNIIKAIRNNCLGINNSCYGYYVSYKKKFNYKSNSCFKKVAQYTLSGKFIRYFDTMEEAQNLLGLSHIYQAINKRGSAGGYQ